MIIIKSLRYMTHRHQSTKMREERDRRLQQAIIARPLPSSITLRFNADYCYTLLPLIRVFIRFTIYMYPYYHQSKSPPPRLLHISRITLQARYGGNKAMQTELKLCLQIYPIVVFIIHRQICFARRNRS